MEDRCTCEDSYEYHECPYDQDVNNNPDSSCNCCEHCTYQCAMDI